MAIFNSFLYSLPEGTPLKLSFIKLTSTVHDFMIAIE